MSSWIHKTKLWEDVANQIIERIRSQEWDVGMKLPSEFELAGMFGVSRDTVRLAIKLLQVYGVIHSRSGSGNYVAERAQIALETKELAAVLAEPDILYSLVQARFVLEPQLAALAAHHAQDREIDRLFFIVSQMEQKEERHSLMTYGYHFHQAVAEYSHNQILVGFYQSVASQLRGVRVLETLTLDTFLKGIEEHKAIARAIAERDGTLAKQLMRSHLKKDYADYLEGSELLEM